MRDARTSAFRLLAATATLMVGGAAAWQVARADWTPIPDSGASVASPGKWQDGWQARPLDAAPFHALGQRSAAAGDNAQAWRFYQIAARRDPRDPGVHVDLFDLARVRGDADTAARHLDALLRIAPDVGTPVLIRALGDARELALRAAVVERLAANPPWRERLPAALADVTSMASAEALLAELGRRSPLRPPEVALRAQLLERMGRPVDARRTWAEALPPNVKSLDGLLFDGGFEAGEGPPPFGWRLHLDGAAAVGLATGHAAEGRQYLALEFDGAILDGETVTQATALPPGIYRWELEADSALSSATRGFAWLMACRPGGLALARMPVPATTRGWEHLAVEVTVPAACPSQLVELVHEGRSASERRPIGEARFDAMHLRRMNP
jgi:tetratricopeptide (TPR) repeat protein